MKVKLDEKYMRLALKEAAKGVGRTSPNPSVGAVIVRNNTVIARGYHKKAGGPHAEINAIKNAREPLSGVTMYVTLEPCNHTGKTPPCTRAIVESGIVRVVIGMKDPNPQVCGGGISYLVQNGIEVQNGILEKECVHLNSAFIKYTSQGIPWMIMKAGVSLDGRLNYQNGKSGWMTGEESLGEVHKLRDKVDAILVGRGTIEIDNPSLTTRLPGKKTKDPVRVIVDSELSIPLSAKIFHLESTAPTWVFCAKSVAKERVAQYENIGAKIFQIQQGEGGLNLKKLISILGKEGICSVLVEGGAKLHGGFLREKMYDYAYLFHAPVFAGDHGLPLIEQYNVKDRESSPRLSEVHYRRMGDDMMVSGRFTYG